MSAPVTLTIVAKNIAEEVRVSQESFKRHDLVDIRVFGRFGGPAAVMMPTKKGLSLQVRQLPALIEALQQAQATIDGGTP